jgi:hypothetical protein
MTWLLIIMTILWPVSLLAAVVLGAYLQHKAQRGQSPLGRTVSFDASLPEPETKPQKTRRIGA